MELKRAADRNNTKDFYNALKEIWGSKKKEPFHLKSADGMETFSDSKRVVARYSEHFQKLLNVPGDIGHEVLYNIPQLVNKTCLDEIPTIAEMVRAAEVWKHGGDNLFSRQTAPTNHQCLGAAFCTTSMYECQHCNHLQER